MLSQQGWPWSGDHHITVEETTEPLAMQCIGDFNSQNLSSNSPNCLPNNSHYVSLENLVSDQLVIPQLIFFFLLITYLHDTVKIY